MLAYWLTANLEADMMVLFKRRTGLKVGEGGQNFWSSKSRWMSVKWKSCAS